MQGKTISSRSITIGIIGGGQLARMSGQAAQRLGYQVAILDSDQKSPASQVTNIRILDDWYSPAGTTKLAELSSVITLENEWVSPENLQLAEAAGANVFPGWKTMQIARDKYLQRQQLASFGLPTPPFRSMNTWADAHAFAEEYGLPIVLKSRHGGYDGYGVVIIRSKEDWQKIPKQDASRWYVEQFVRFESELAVMVSRNLSGDTQSYPVVESRQTVDGYRCDLVIAPAPAINEEIAARARAIGVAVVDALEGVGIYGVELFSVGEELFVNEVAPRPHNSGHYTMDGAATSQFEQHIRSILDLPLGPTELLAPVVVMANLLAPRNGDLDLQSSIQAALQFCPELHVHWYGKSDLRIGRKMGHLNLLGTDVQQTIDRAIAARSAFWQQ